MYMHNYVVFPLFCAELQRFEKQMIIHSLFPLKVYSLTSKHCNKIKLCANNFQRDHLCYGGRDDTKRHTHHEY